MISLMHISKKFKRYTIPINTLKSYLINYGKYIDHKSKVTELTVIKDLSIELQESDILCVVGPNGAGKSTLAKMMAGTCLPDEGTIIVKGRIVPFLELGVAFSNELSGRDNVYMNGVLLGLSLSYIKLNLAKIFEFAELDDFIDTPLKFYSSGMQMRLAFSVAMHAQGDIYIFDEILAVGDFKFQRKCFDAFESLVNNKKTIILISHDLATVKKYATKILILKDGKHKILNDQKHIKSLTEEDINCTL